MMNGCKMNRSIVVALESKQWLPVEKWDNGLLQRYCEDRAIHQMLSKKTKTTLHHCPVRDDNCSTMAIAFSCDGRYFASGHTSHDIIIGHMTPYIHYWKRLSGHERTPWELTFDLEQPHVLYSGCLAGRVCKWNIQEGRDCECLFDSNLSSPVNSITCLPSDSHLLLVAIRCNLFVLSAADLTVVWVTQAANFETFRLVLHHPIENKILLAISNPHDEMVTTTYKFELHLFRKDQQPALDNPHRICPRARVFSSHSCVLTDRYFICIAYDPSMHSLNVYSMLDQSCGDCLYSMPIGRSNLTSIDLSPHNGYILLGFVARRSTFHYEAARGLCDTEIHTFIDCGATTSTQQLSVTPSNEQIGRFQIEKVGSIPTRGSNVAVWMPLSAGHGYGACIATSKSGSVLFWRTVEQIDTVKFDSQ